MRFSSFFLFIVFSLFGCQNQQGEAHLVKESVAIVVADSLLKRNVKNGRKTYAGEEFTGIAEKYYPNQQIAESVHYLSGKKHGEMTKWFPDGKISFIAQYHHGKKNGAVISWWVNGNMRSMANFDEGVPDGVQKQWFQSGAKFKVLNLNQGKEEGLQRSWRENGKLYCNYEAKNGRIFGLKRANLCFQLEDENIVLNEKDSIK
ncbi:toxin-antitoxin system YwqK family antitoxin [Putridiphycobacter roseus]|uniref:Toxin-antitoxin system YwqK family antitoxin n=2 Tax=Putridiphycobacter roseus TaxID=2219161 RepID=A0A2W1NFY3_9FLAO|nr:toxin-antitoxin system YwqK family antitoxin [Putridiphycobacter roseus]